MIKDAKFIICDENKTPKHSYNQWHTLNDVKNEDNLGILIEQPYVIVDVDDKVEFDIVCKIIDRLHLKTKILKTSRGGHFWFKTSLPLTNVTHFNTPLTVTVDIKSWGKHSMEIVKQGGVWREWLKEDDDVDELPKWLTPTTLITKHFYGMDEGEGRNDALFSCIYNLIKLKFSKEEVRELFYLINEFMFSTPLNYKEIDAMIDNNDVFNSKQYNFFDGKSFLHHIFADYMIDHYKIRYYAGKVYVYDGRIYTCNDELIRSKMVETLPSIKRAQIEEVYNNIKLKILSNPCSPNTEYLNLSNGLLKLSDLSMIPHTDEIFTINRLDITYNPECVDKDVDKLFNSITCGKQEIINLLYQMIGYILVPTNVYQKAFILLGNGANGKSVLLETIRCLFGDENCSALSLEDLGTQYKPSELIGKLVNIGDDSGHNLLENTAVFKKVVTGDIMTFERKYEHPFQHRNTSKLIFAANALPPTTDKSEGFFRRCIIIPFDAVFKPGDKTYDPNIIKKVTTSNAKSYLLNLALIGLQILNENKYFVETDDTKRMLTTYMINNNTVEAWFYTVKPSTATPYMPAFSSYTAWCAKCNYKPCSIGKFKLEYERLKQLKEEKAKTQTDN